MKNLLLILFALLTVQVANAQVKAGRIVLGGQVEYSSSTVSSTVSGGGFNQTNSVSVNSFSIMPYGAYMLNDKIALGLGIGYSSAAVPATGTSGGGDVKTFSVQPFARYYKSIGGSDKFYFYGQATLAYSSISTTTGSTSSPALTGLGFSVSPNIAFFPAELISIDFGLAGIGYTTVGNEIEDNGVKVSQSTSNFVFGVNSLAPRLSLSLWF